MNMIREHFQRALCACILACSSMPLTACTSSTPATPTAAYTPPAWMAEQAAETERWNAFTVDCMARAGYQVTAVIDGGVSADDGGLKGDAAKKWQEAFDKANWDCYQAALATLGETPALDDDTNYKRMSETAECVRANGYPEIGQPPSRDTWIESVSNSDKPWSAYRELYKLHPEISKEAWYKLKSTCVEGGGVSFSVSFPDRPGTAATS